MRSVVEAYVADGFIARHHVELVASYIDGGFIRRQIALLIALLKFGRLLATRPIGLVHCHAAMRGSFWRKNLFAIIARRLGHPVILHLHGSEMRSFYASQPPILKRVIRHLLERASRVIVLSESWREFVSSIAPNAQIVVVPNYVRVPALPSPGVRREQQVAFLGLVGDRKGVFDLIPAFASLANRHPAARLTIAGNGEVERAARAVSALGIGGQITLPGWTDGAARARLLEESSIYVLPSYNEGLPMSVLEAMAAGLATVTSRAGGLPELIRDGVDGLLIDAGDQQGISAALDRLLTDSALRERLMRAGRARVEQSYSDRVVLPMLDAIYDELLIRS